MRVLIALVAATLALASAATAAEAERLTYRVEYKGIFSVGEQIPIADAVMSTRVPSSTGDYRETELSVTSEEYPFVEALYPVRYLFRTWYTERNPRCLALEKYQKTSKVKHQLIELARGREEPVSLDLTRTDSDLLGRLRAGSLPVSEPDESTVPAFDRLSMLAVLRDEPLHAGFDRNYRVTTGSKWLQYRVRVLTRENIAVGGRNWPAWKVRFDGVETDGRGREEHAHRAVYLWISADARRLPLRAVSRHPIGRFIVELNDRLPVLEQAERPSDL